MRVAGVIRVGICGCTKRYQEKIRGKRLLINGELYALEEFTISDGLDQLETLAQTGCHFFLDVHRKIMINWLPRPQRLVHYATRLDRHLMWPTHRGSNEFGYIYANSRSWFRNRPAEIGDVLEEIQKMAEEGDYRSYFFKIQPGARLHPDILASQFQTFSQAS